MPVRVDPEEHEPSALFELMPGLSGLRILEVGCGDGRLTWRYARSAASVLAVDPEHDEIAVAQEALPPELRGRVELRATGIAELSAPEASFDLAIMSWVL